MLPQFNNVKALSKLPRLAGQQRHETHRNQRLLLDTGLGLGEAHEVLRALLRPQRQDHDTALGQLLNDPTLAKNLTGTSSNLESISGRIKSGDGTIGKLINEDDVYKRIESLTNRFDTLAERLNTGQGTAGQLLQDKQLYENMNQAASELRGLIGDIRKDPKKYLNVKVSIF